MRTIWKWPVEPAERFEVAMPKGARVIKVDAQGMDRLPVGISWLWAEVDTNQPRVVRVFGLFGTGHPIPVEADRHCGSFFMTNGGELVFHLYEYSNAG